MATRCFHGAAVQKVDSRNKLCHKIVNICRSYMICSYKEDYIAAHSTHMTSHQIRSGSWALVLQQLSLAQAPKPILWLWLTSQANYHDPRAAQSSLEQLSHPKIAIVSWLYAHALLLCLATSPAFPVLHPCHLMLSIFIFFVSEPCITLGKLFFLSC